MLTSEQITKFAILGQIIDLTFKGDDAIKHIQLQTYKGEVWIKASKQLRLTLKNSVSVGDTVLVEGEKQVDRKNGRLKFKAHAVTVKQVGTPVQFASSHTFEATTQANSQLPSRSKADLSPATILVCQKSDCQKRGSQSICRLLEQTLRDRGLDENITIKKVGCIKQCKSGPHVVLMPDKTRYSQVKPNRIPELIEKHFPAAKQPQSA